MEKVRYPIFDEQENIVVTLSFDNIEDYPEFTGLFNKWVPAELIPNERYWRNLELGLTDWMLVPDATYAGELLAGSQKLTDIMDYRTRLREYNLTTDDRPSRPEWFNG